MNDILYNGLFMLLCAFGSLVLAFIVGYIISFLTASFSYKLREALFKKVEKIANWEVNEVRDYQTHKIVKRDGSESETDLPTSNVLYYDLSDNSWFAVRPSGTEPKIKLYIGVKGSSEQEANFPFFKIIK